MIAAKKSVAVDFRILRIVSAAVAAGIVLLLPQALMVKVAPRRSTWVPRIYHRVFCGLTGVKVETVGDRVLNRPVMYVANHISWLDIPVIGSQIPGSFVAKAEVGNMGVFGTLSRLQRTIYVEREARHRSADQRDIIIERMAQGDNVILFPEGTSSNGNSVLPFKSALFSVAEQAAGNESLIDLLIQPVTVAYVELNGMPMVRAHRGKIAWIGDEELGPHVLQILRLGRVKALVHYHPPVRFADFQSRKDLAAHCQDVIAQGLRRANSGRARLQE